jgi:hypothetical protein
VEKTSGDEHRSPKITIDLDESRYVAVRLGRKGFGGGDVDRIMAMDADKVLLMLEYLNFENEYERAFFNLNRGGK